MGKPNSEDIEDYDLYTVDNISVYVRADIRTKDEELTISYKKLFFIGNFVVEGIAY